MKANHILWPVGTMKYSKSIVNTKTTGLGIREKRGKGGPKIKKYSLQTLKNKGFSELYGSLSQKYVLTRPLREVIMTIQSIIDYQS